MDLSRRHVRSKRSSFPASPAMDKTPGRPRALTAWRYDVAAPWPGAEETTVRFDWGWVLVAAGALMILVEVLLGGFTGFDLALIGSAFILGGALGLVTGSAPAGFVVASVLCILYIAVGRRWVRARLKHGQIPSNVDAVIGRKAVVTRRIAPHEPGQVKVQDEVWRAVPADDAPGPFEQGTVVTVAGVNGVTLQVR
jgi:membrane protein implicated in regulation of membrane protease activity